MVSGYEEIKSDLRRTVSANDTGGEPVSDRCKTVSGKSGSVSVEGESVSARLILNQIYHHIFFSKAKCKELIEPLQTDQPSPTPTIALPNLPESSSLGKRQ
jgi:hypothetical protein